MLIDNAPEGSYLLRPSATGTGKQYSLSVKLSNSVQHMKVDQLVDGRFKFGLSYFADINSLKRHFEHEKPVVGGESGINVFLKYPYSRDIDEEHIYTEIHHHAVTNMDELHDSQSTYTSESEDSLQGRLSQITPVSSREGYMTKLGRVRKNWKVRWFVLRNTTLSYYKTKQSSKPIRSIDVLKATSVDYDSTYSKDFSFRLVCPSRTFYFFANNMEDCDQWVELLRATILRRESRDLIISQSHHNTNTDF
jgi:dual adaptor for phosphotyrosine/3-phosphotyrosine/3-phosphoinositide